MALAHIRKNRTAHTTQKLRTNPEQIPSGSVLLGVLKTVETELRKRDLLGSGDQACTPLWFLAETERNVFLWRSGKGLDDQRDYSFWVNILELISKRREQLRNPVGLNPFINPLWGSAPLNDQLVQNEFDYLECIEELAATVFKHAEALSHASETIRAELEHADIAKRICIVLPAIQRSA
jgi:hypothetical protein